MSGDESQLSDKTGVTPRKLLQLVLALAAGLYLLLAPLDGTYTLTVMLVI